VLAGWVGWLAVLAGILSVAVGVDVSYSGLDSGIQRVAVPAFQVVMLVFAIGVVVTAARGRVGEPAAG
jgi:phosphotransferase system  glucose/maltose/N-acetylglucosamine-specific IIC component